MERVYNFLKEAGTYFLATVDKDQPRVRPFGTVNIFEGKLYIQRSIGKLNSSCPISLTGTYYYKDKGWK